MTRPFPSLSLHFSPILSILSCLTSSDVCSWYMMYKTVTKHFTNVHNFSAVQSWFNSLALYFLFISVCVSFCFAFSLSPPYLAINLRLQDRLTCWTSNVGPFRQRTWRFEARSGIELQRRAWSMKMQGNPYVGHWNTAFVSHSKWFIPLSNSSAKEYGLLYSVRLPASLWCWRNMSFLLSGEHLWNGSTDIQTEKNLRHL